MKVSKEFMDIKNCQLPDKSATYETDNAIG